MILDEELARTFRQKILEEIFGADWRPERPLENIGSNLNVLLQGQGVKDLGDYKLRAGVLQGLIRALEIFTEAAKATNEVPGT